MRAVRSLSAAVLHGSAVETADPDAAYHHASVLFLAELGSALAVACDHPDAAKPLVSRVSRDVQTGARGCQDVHDAVTQIVRQGVPPHATLSGCYEALLRLRPVVEESGALTLRRRPSRRGAAYYTPPSIARAVTAAALAPLDGRRCPTVFDPAMGTGIFLLAACSVIHSTRGTAARDLAENELFGTDIDPIAVAIAVTGLCLETGARPDMVGRHLRCADALLDPPAVSGADVVLGNPPWGGALPAETRRAVSARWPASTRLSFDSFKPFLELASTTSRGTIGMIVPRAVLCQPLHADVRALLLERMAPYTVMHLANGIFSDAVAPASALVWGPRPGPPTIGVASLDGTASIEVAPSAWSATRGFLTARPDAVDLLDALLHRHPSLGDVSDTYRVRDGGINYNRASVASRVFYTGAAPQDPRDRRRYRGRNFRRYSSIQPDGWLRHDAHRLLAPGESLTLNRTLYDRAEKIVLRQTADRPIATLDRSRMALGRSVLAVTAEEGASLPALLACLNSRLLTVLYRAMAGETGRLLPQVKVGRLLALPVPAVCAGGAGPTAEMWRELETLATRMLLANGADAPLDARIDRLVYALYGLTEWEIDLVTEETSRDGTRRG